MNYDMIRYVLFRAFSLVGALMLLPVLVALIYGEMSCALIFGVMALVTLLIGFAGTCKKPENRMFYAREGYVMCALIWLLISLLGALPFVLTGTIPSYVDALFETVSGFTTTGASILTSVDGMYMSVQFFRCFTHWIGGMGVLVFMLAIIPMSGGSTMHLMRAESPGPSVGKLVPRVKNTAKMLYLIYFGLTVAQIVLLLVTGLNLYEAMTITFSTVGTGGFSITDAGMNAYPLAAQIVVILFMTLCGINFSVYYLIQTGKIREALKSEELRWYLSILFASSVLIAANVIFAGRADSAFDAFHHALFSVSSVMTTTGFATRDFNLWPQFSRTLLFILTLLGASAGSTGGGLKVSRLIIMVRRIKNEIIFATHRKSVRQVYMDGRRVGSTTVKSVTTYVSIYVLVYLVSFLLISLDGLDFETNITAVAATLNNVGPGLSAVGPTGNYAQYSILSKLVLCFDMLAGRLEFIPLMILLRYRTWSERRTV
ncbi:MAG: TrkH family potassium uptake protein [Lachnospiraceae bacterium]|nr:TrkH family potassium uptake protein [Lachnospiraceae bacterium]